MGQNNKVVVIGANGTMGSGAGCVFAGAGYAVTMLARSREKAAEGLKDAQSDARAEAISERIAIGAYDADLPKAISEAAIIFESLAEDAALKKKFFEIVDQHRRPESIVATGSSGLSIAGMAQGRSDSFRKNFLGIHLFNPPHVIVGTEVIPGPETDPAIVKHVVAMLASQLGRKVIVAKDKPAFVGNRVGFKVLNEIAQLAEEHGIAYMDYLIGPHTGRAMPPLATIDLVGWDVHKAIVDNVYANCKDEAHDCFKMPAYMDKALHEGCLGDKTPERGGFYRRAGKKEVFVLDPKTGEHQPLAKPEPIEFVEKMKGLNRVGRYAEAFKALADAPGAAGELCRRIVLGYVSYGLNRVGEVAATPADVDTIMSYGFNWAPPTAIVDLIGAKNTIAMMKSLKLPIPPVLDKAASNGARMFTGGILEYGRTFVG
ncbi:MAG TPA: 3-hydroxyacyl-CoA dehydrogenase NAD-binding domain-containing protein [Candidatus Binataceae bacterium]|nr:3-hydroxyacyl-CoA dehydrogenase NAD-binding domain-containing protein [Candidatus Binataceae bacterium]